MRQLRERVPLGSGPFQPRERRGAARRARSPGRAHVRKPLSQALAFARVDDRREGRAGGTRCGPERAREAVQGGREASGEGPGAAALGPPWAAALRVQTGPRRSKLGRLAPGAAAKADAGC